MEQHFVEEPCQEGWHRPVLSLFAKVFTVFSCKLPKVACFQKFAFAKRSANASLPHGRQNRLTSPAKKNRKFPMGNSLSYLSCVDFCGVRPIQGCPLFLFYPHSSAPWRPAAFHRRMQVVFSKKQASPKEPSQGSFGEAVIKKKNYEG